MCITLQLELIFLIWTIIIITPLLLGQNQQWYHVNSGAIKCIYVNPSFEWDSEWMLVVPVFVIILNSSQVSFGEMATSASFVHVSNVQTNQWHLTKMSDLRYLESQRRQKQGNITNWTFPSPFSSLSHVIGSWECIPIFSLSLGLNSGSSFPITQWKKLQQKAYCT